MSPKISQQILPLVDMKTDSINPITDVFHPLYMPEIDPNPCVSRGRVLSGVLNGLAGYDSIPVLSDCAPNDPDSDIEYDPSSDQRLDRFDGVELGVEVMDEATSPSVEKKE